MLVVFCCIAAFSWVFIISRKQGGAFGCFSPLMTADLEGDLKPSGLYSLYFILLKKRFFFSIFNAAQVLFFVVFFFLFLRICYSLDLSTISLI